MDINQIRELAKVLNENMLTAVEVSENGGKIRLEKTMGALVPNTAPMPCEPVKYSEPVNVPAAPVEEKHQEPAVDYSNLKEVKSPMVGVFYKAPAPDEEPFVKVGDKVKKGDVLCVIEAMKLMNEITATSDGEVVDVCVENGQVVEYSQTLFKLI